MVKKKKKKNPNETRGRHTLFSETVATKIIELAGKGKTDKQIAALLGVHENTIHNWKKIDQPFLWSFKEAKEKANEMVVASLFKRATGYTHTYENEKVVSNPVFGSEVIKYQETLHVAPDPKAIEFWLRNRQPKDWRDQQNTNVVNNAINVQGQTIPSHQELLQSMGGLMYAEFKRLEAKQKIEGLSSEDVNSLAKLTKTLMDIKEGKEDDAEAKRKRAASMTTEELMQTAKSLIAQAESKEVKSVGEATKDEPNPDQSGK